MLIRPEMSSFSFVSHCDLGKECRSFFCFFFFWCTLGYPRFRGAREIKSWWHDQGALTFFPSLFLHNGWRALRIQYLTKNLTLTTTSSHGPMPFTKPFWPVVEAVAFLKRLHHSPRVTVSVIETSFCCFPQQVLKCSAHQIIVFFLYLVWVELHAHCLCYSPGHADAGLPPAYAMLLTSILVLA